MEVLERLRNIREGRVYGETQEMTWCLGDIFETPVEPQRGTKPAELDILKCFDKGLMFNLSDLVLVSRW